MSLYTRVTAALAPLSGLNMINPEVLANACARGTEIHKLCDAVIEGFGTPEVHDDWRGYLNSFLLFEQGKKFMRKPPRLFCDKYMITGEIDGLYKDGDEIILFDLKTPLRESKTWCLQLSAYWHLCKVNDIKVEKIIAVKLDKNGKPPKIFEYKIDFEAYVECLNVYNRFFKNKGTYEELDLL
ncbi:MAG: hypothetical protein Q8876_05690 [Bacillota bacterium]|nr:hypothetical protein [Bacillota bacterium]